jgi:hypothetical protein
MVVKQRKMGKEDYEECRPCFCDHGLHVDENFYVDNTAATVVDDMWKKFDLPPTPPLSPKHDASVGIGDGDDVLNTMLDLSVVFDKLESRKTSRSSSFSENGLQSNLIQDCMWSAPGLAAAGICADVKKEATESDKSMPLSQNIVDINSNECVDPTAVFPYPVNQPADDSVVPCIRVGTETPSESEVCESSDDDEIVDVETVDVDVPRPTFSSFSATSLTPRKAVSSLLPPSSSTCAPRIASMHNYSSSATKRISVSYSAPHTPRSSHSALKRTFSSPSSPSFGGPSPMKRAKLMLSDADLRRVSQKLRIELPNGYTLNAGMRSSGSHTGNSSDSEDCYEPQGKRAQHNVLERQRRNDLKSSFLMLRDSVPDLGTNERAPKVVILRKAVDFCNNLTYTNRQLQAQRDHYRQVHERLKRRLLALRREAAM